MLMAPRMLITLNRCYKQVLQVYQYQKRTKRKPRNPQLTWLKGKKYLLKYNNQLIFFSRDKTLFLNLFLQTSLSPLFMDILQSSSNKLKLGKIKTRLCLIMLLNTWKTSMLIIKGSICGKVYAETQETEEMLPI